MNNDTSSLVAIIWNLTERLDRQKYVASVMQKDEQLVITYQNGFIHKIPLYLEKCNKEELLNEIKHLVQTSASVQFENYQINLNHFLEEEFLKIRSTIEIPKNGIDGRDGLDGKDGIDGRDGLNGQNGISVNEEDVINKINLVLQEQLLSSLDQCRADLNNSLDAEILNITQSIALPQNGKDGIDGRDGLDGKDGKDADELAIIQQMNNFIEQKIQVIQEQLVGDLKIQLQNMVNSLPLPKDGKDADEDGLKNHLVSIIDSKFLNSIKELKNNIKNLDESKKHSKSSTGERGKQGERGKKGEKGERGERGNSVIDAKIDKRDHLIIYTDDKIIDAGELKIKKAFGRGSSGGGAINQPFSYTNLLKMPKSVGGFKKGTRFLNVDLKEIVTKLLYGYDMPYFSSFTIDNIPEIIEIGYTIVAGDYQTNFTVTNPELLRDNSLSSWQNGVEIFNSSPIISPSTLSVAEATYNSPVTVTFEISAYDTTGTSFNRYFTSDFRYRIYYGEYTDDITDNAFANPLTVLRATELVNNITSEYLFLPVGFKWFCFPEALGENYVFFEISSDVALVMDDVRKIDITNEYGLLITYNCYRTLNELNEEFVMGVKIG